MLPDKHKLDTHPGQSNQSSPDSKSKGLQTNFLQQHARLWMATLLFLSDAACLMLAGLAAVGLRLAMGNLINPPFYWSLVPYILIFLAIYALRGLYPAVGMSPVEELRNLTVITSVVFLFITGFTFWVRTAEYYSRLIFAFSWALAVISVPVGRWILRVLAIRLKVWGEPVAIIGYGPQAQRIAEFLIQRMHLGLQPVAFVASADVSSQNQVELPVFRFGKEAHLNSMLGAAGIHTAILITNELPPKLQDVIVNEQYFKFRQLILITSFNWVGSIGVVSHDLEGFLGLEVRQSLLNPWEQRLKRLIDLVFSLGFGVLALPLLGVIALIIRLDSRGEVFYRHMRIGKAGRSIKVLKFRTMVADADRLLDEYLEDQPDALLEWEKNFKIKNDPRITPVGKFLRKFSLDELPQLWNILKGEMSLVGPRPIVSQEIERYKQGYSLYQRVRPGMTGLWQVSGRTDVSYAERIRFDEYYVRNWSIWLDVYILARTAWFVLQGKGAY
jgi:Undecaprenyl-phosphate galactose phosphotransferase WbaP